MYFRASQLPHLSTVRYRQRVGILVAAAWSHNRWMFVRIALVFVLMIATTSTIAFWFPSLDFPDWSGTAAGVLFGTLFYALLVWEMNGPLGAAVQKYLSGGE